MDVTTVPLRDRVRHEGGFTLVELMVVVALMAVAGTLALVGLRGYGGTQDHQGSANELVSDLRNAGQRAVTEGRTYCMHVDAAAEQWTLYRKSCSAAGAVLQGPTRTRGDVRLGNLQITSTVCPQPSSCIYFKPRGTATGGTSADPERSKLDIERAGSAAITVTVEGLTARVDRS